MISFSEGRTTAPRYRGIFKGPLPISFLEKKKAFLLSGLLFCHCKVRTASPTVVLRMNWGREESPLAQTRPTHVYFKNQSRALYPNRQRPTPPRACSCDSNTPQTQPGLELAWVGISDPVTPESSISGRKQRRLRVTLCRLNTALSSEPRWVGGAVSSRGCRWQLTRREGTDTGGGCLDVDGMQR